VKDVVKYGYTFTDPGDAGVPAYRELTQYFATATLDSPVEGGSKDRPQAIMTFGRAEALRVLRQRVQATADQFFGPARWPSPTWASWACIRRRRRPTTSRPS